jgi:hypothetical protein
VLRQEFGPASYLPAFRVSNLALTNAGDFDVG